MRLHCEASVSYRGHWVWRVRSNDTRVGETFLAIGQSKTEAQAWAAAKSVQAACAPLFTQAYRAVEDKP